MFYMLSVIMILGFYQALKTTEHQFCEKSRSFPAVDKDGNYEEVKTLDIFTQFTDGRKNCARWFVAWGPPELRAKFEDFEEPETWMNLR